MHKRELGRQTIVMARWRSEGEGHTEQGEAERADGKADQDHDAPLLLVIVPHTEYPFRCGRHDVRQTGMNGPTVDQGDT